MFLLSILQTDPGAMDDFENFLGESPRNHWPRVQQIMAESSTYAPHDKGILVSTGVLGKGLVEVDITLHWLPVSDVSNRWVDVECTPWTVPGAQMPEQVGLQCWRRPDLDPICRC